MHLSAYAKRLVFLLAFLAASMFASLLYFLFFNSIIEATALPRSLDISKELAAANRPELYLEVCRALVQSVEDGEKLRLAVMALLRVTAVFMVVGSGLLLLLGLRLLRLSGHDIPSHATPGRLSPARLADHLIALWEGKPSLRSAFWAFSLPVALAMGVALRLWAQQLSTKGLESMLYMSIASGIALTVYVFSLYVVWRCAGNTAKKLWTWLARGAVALLVAHLALKVYVALAHAAIPLLGFLRLI